MRPSAKMARKPGRAAIRASRKFRQWAISLGVGLLAGGTQRTALVIMQSVSVSAASEPDLEQSAVEQLAGIVTEEGTPGAIGALQSRREPDDQEPRAVGAEGRNRAVEPVGMGGPVGRTEGDEAWTDRTIRSGFRCCRARLVGKRHWARQAPPLRFRSDPLNRIHRAARASAAARAGRVRQDRGRSRFA